MELFDITTGTGDFIANGVVSHNCFARPTHTYLDFNAREDFEKQIVVKVNAPELVRAETRRPSWKRELVALGTNTDPYQWVEGRYKLMPGIWEALRDSRTPCSVLTKSPLVTRDIALLKEMSDMGLFSAAFSVPTIDEKAWRASEPRTPNPYARLEAAAELSRNGIAVSVLVAPLMPGINDDPRQVEKILELAAEAGVVNVTGIHLHLRGEVKDITMDWLSSYRPDLVPRYERLYGRGAYAPQGERDRMSALIEDGWAKVAPGHKRHRRYVRTADDPASHRVPEAAQEDLQGALF
jgi:DNA repair photolyase